MSIMDKLAANSRIKASATLAESKLFSDKKMVKTSVPMINVALSGDIDGGLSSGLTVLAGPSKHFKTSFGLLIASAYLKEHDDAVILFYDSEFGSPQSYFEGFGIDTNRVLHTPIMNVEELKFDLVNQLENLEVKDKVIILIDSIGNLASKKELEDAKSEKSVADMSRAKALKGLFRMVTPYLTMKDIPLIAINHTYQEIGLFPKAVVSGGCVVAGTEIQTIDGLKNVEDFNVGEKVITLDGEREVTHVWNPDTLEDGNPECYEIEFEDGYTVTCSDKHKFLVNGGWVKAEDLKVGVDVNQIENRIMKIAKINKVGKKPVYDLSVKDNEHYILKNGVVTHNTGIYYSADNIWIIGRQQEKKGTEIKGYNFIINIEKSRFVREKSKIPIAVTWEGGIMPYSGLLEVALEGKYVVKPNIGWYARVDTETGVVEDKKVREKDTLNKEFWAPVFANTDFKDFIKKRFQIGQMSMLDD